MAVLIQEPLALVQVDEAYAQVTSPVTYPSAPTQPEQESVIPAPKQQVAPPALVHQVQEEAKDNQPLCQLKGKVQQRVWIGKGERLEGVERLIRKKIINK